MKDRTRKALENLLGQVVQARDGFGIYQQSKSMDAAVKEAAAALASQPSSGEGRMNDSRLREALEHMANDLVIELKKNLPVSLHTKVVGIVQQELRNSLAVDVSVEPERVELRSAFEFEIYQCDE